jgi:hypothetical protein
MDASSVKVSPRFAVAAERFNLGREHHADQRFHRPRYWSERGLGLAFTKALITARARKVYGAVHDPASIMEPGVTPIKLDVTELCDMPDGRGHAYRMRWSRRTSPRSDSAVPGRTRVRRHSCAPGNGRSASPNTSRATQPALPAPGLRSCRCHGPLVRHDGQDRGAVLDLQRLSSSAGCHTCLSATILVLSRS